MPSANQDLDDHEIQPWVTTDAHLRIAGSLIARLNAQTVEWLVGRTDQATDRRVGLPSDLAPQVRTRLAAFPIGLANIHFEDADWWRRTRLHSMGTASSEGVDPESGVTLTLAREVLMLARHMARTPQMPRFLLGMAPEVARILADLSMGEIDDIARRLYSNLRPRWEDTPGFWAEFLGAAQDSDEARWTKIQLHAFQLLGRDLLSHGVDLPTSRARRASS